MPGVLRPARVNRRRRDDLPAGHLDVDPRPLAEPGHVAQLRERVYTLGDSIEEFVSASTGDCQRRRRLSVLRRELGPALRVVDVDREEIATVGLIPERDSYAGGGGDVARLRGEICGVGRGTLDPAIEERPLLTRPNPHHLEPSRSEGEGGLECAHAARRLRAGILHVRGSIPHASARA